MNLQVENLEKSMAKLTVTIPAADFEKAVTDSYNKNKNKYQVQGFRKGKAPQHLIEKMYGEGVFFEDAVNQIIDKTYADALKESGVDCVSKARFDLEKIGKNEDLVYTAEVAVRPEVKLGQYKNVQIEKTPAEVTDADVDAEIAKQQEQNARLISVEDRAAQTGDTAVIDFEGFVDGVPFEGGKGEDFSLELGSHSFIDTFEDQIVGHKTGDAFDVNVTFPEKYQAAELAGKPAVFKTAIKEIKAKELPEVDDEFASEVSEFDTVDEWKNSIREKLSADKAASAKTADENKLVAKVTEGCEVELPELMVETRVDDAINDYARNMSMQGLKFEDYLKYLNMTMEQFRERLEPQAKGDLKTSLVLEAIAKAENLQAAEEDVDAEIAKMAESYQMEAADVRKYLGDAGIDEMRENLKVKKAVDLIVENADFT